MFVKLLLLGYLGVVALSTASLKCQIPKCLQDSWALSSVITRRSHKETLESWWVKIHRSYMEMRCWERVGSKSTSPCLSLCSGRRWHLSWGLELESRVRYSLWKALLPPITPGTSWPRGTEHIPKPCFMFTLSHPELQGEPQWGLRGILWFSVGLICDSSSTVYLFRCKPQFSSYEAKTGFGVLISLP